MLALIIIYFTEITAALIIGYTNAPIIIHITRSHLTSMATNVVATCINYNMYSFVITKHVVYVGGTQSDVI